MWLSYVTNVFFSLFIKLKSNRKPPWRFDHERRINAGCRAIDHATQLMFNRFKRITPPRVWRVIHFSALLPKTFFTSFAWEIVYYYESWALRRYSRAKVFNILPTPWNSASLSQQIPRENSADIPLCMGFNAISLLSAFTLNRRYIMGCIMAYYVFASLMTVMVFSSIMISKH